MIIKFDNIPNTLSINTLKKLIAEYLNKGKNFYNIEDKENEILYKCIWWGFFVIANPFKQFASKGSIRFESINGGFIVEFQRNYVVSTFFQYIIFYLPLLVLLILTPFRLIWIPILCLLILIIISMGISYISFKYFVKTIKELILKEIKR
jgi:hypothetical protein